MDHYTHTVTLPEREGFLKNMRLNTEVRTTTLSQQYICDALALLT
jgi:hypothetical protein